MRDTLSTLLLSNEPSTSAYDEHKFTVFAYLHMLKVFNFFIRYFMNSCCTTLQTHVRIEIDLVCSYGEIDACSRNIGMKIDSLVDFISTWINLLRQKIV